MNRLLFCIKLIFFRIFCSIYYEPNHSTDMYTPPFTISAHAINLIAEISGQIERYAIRLEQSDAMKLRKS